MAKCKPFLDYPSLAEFVFTSLMKHRYRDDIIKDMTDNGYTRQTAIKLYQCYRRRFFEYHQRKLEAT